MGNGLFLAVLSLILVTNCCLGKNADPESNADSANELPNDSVKESEVDYKDDDRSTDATSRPFSMEDHEHADHISGGLPIITDATFSLIILLYVSITFCFIFFMFCWNSDGSNSRGGAGGRKCLLTKRDGMMTRIEITEPVVIPPTPTAPSRSSQEEAEGILRVEEQKHDM